MKRLIYLILFSWIGISSCDSFLKEYSQDLVYARSVTDLSELLVGAGYAPTDKIVGDDLDFPGLHIMDDDAEFLPIYADGVVPQLGFYNWARDPFHFDAISVDDPVWKWLYERIGTLNVILAKVEDFKAEDETGYRKVKGEAYFLRACYYFHLVNLYAKPYVKATATADPGIPIKLTEYVEDKYYERSSIAEVYSLVVSDLKEAIVLLEGIRQPSVYRANTSAAHALLGRVYLYMNEWELVIKECDEVIDEYKLLDLNSYKGISFTNAGSTETIFSMGQNCFPELMADPNTAVGMYAFVVSPSLIESFGKNDLRPALIYIYSDYNPEPPRCHKLKEKDKEIVSDRFLIRLPEVYLNKAEALAMLDRNDLAIEVLQGLRVNRYKNHEAPEISETGVGLLKEIRKERRVELCFEGHRWFDLRRYAVSTKYPEVTEIRHPYYTSNYTATPDLHGYYILKPYPEDKAWVLPIPGYAIVFNEGVLVQNDERESRDWKSL